MVPMPCYCTRGFSASSILIVLLAGVGNHRLTLPTPQTLGNDLLTPADTQKCSRTLRWALRRPPAHSVRVTAPASASSLRRALPSVLAQDGASQRGGDEL